MESGRRMRQRFRAAGITVLFFLILGMSGCGKNATESEQQRNGCGNTVMGNGSFLMDEDLVYYTDKEYIYRYDRTVKEVTVSPAEDVYGQMNFWNGRIVYKKFSDGDLYALNLNGELEGRVYENPEERHIAQLYIEGDDWYYLTGYGGELVRFNPKTRKETVLCDQVRSFYVTEEKVYVIRQEAEAETILMVSAKEDMAFETIPLPFSPVCVFPMITEDTTTLYLNKTETFELVAVSEEGVVLKEYPIHTLYYQVGNESIYYMDQDTFDTDYRLMSYSIQSGEKKTLADHVFDFCVLEGRYIGICRLFENSYWLYDTVTGEGADMTMKGNTASGLS